MTLLRVTVIKIIALIINSHFVLNDINIETRKKGKIINIYELLFYIYIYIAYFS